MQGKTARSEAPSIDFPKEIIEWSKKNHGDVD
jgi:hypothetical protein